MNYRLGLGLIFICSVFASCAQNNTENISTPTEEITLFNETATIPSWAESELGQKSRRIQDRVIALNLNALQPSTSIIHIKLFSEDTWTARIKRTFVRDDGSMTWFGTIDGDSLGRIGIRVDGDHVFGQIHLQHRSFQIRSIGAGFVILEELEPHDIPLCSDHIHAPDPETNALPTVVPPLAKNPNTGEIVYPDGSHTSEGNGDSETTSTTSTIDMMVLYTEDAMKAAAPFYDNNDSEYIKTEIEYAADDTSNVFANSNIDAQVSIVYTMKTSKEETASTIEEYLDWLRDKGRDSSSNIYKKRNSYNADVVSMWVADGVDACGIGYLMESESQSFAQSAFNVVDRNCVDTYVVPHELGHNLGAHHDTYVSPEDGLTSYAHGYTINAINAYTIMAYNDACHDQNDWWDELWNPCERLGYFSSPDIKVDGYTIGNASTANNTLVLQTTVDTAASFSDYYD